MRALDELARGRSGWAESWSKTGHPWRDVPITLLIVINCIGGKSERH